MRRSWLPPLSTWITSRTNSVGRDVRVPPPLQQRSRTLGSQDLVTRISRRRNLAEGRCCVDAHNTPIAAQRDARRRACQHNPTGPQARGGVSLRRHHDTHSAVDSVRGVARCGAFERIATTPRSTASSAPRSTRGVTWGRTSEEHDGENHTAAPDVAQVTPVRP